jgi:geranylgeranyl diphosphate synthase type I
VTVLVQSTLREGRDLTGPALRAAVERLDPTNRAIARYHFGWTDAAGRPAEGSSGKAIRPTLALLSARAGGAAATVGVPGAVAVELVHNFSLIHDDLMDGDATRRHRPTVWTLWGSAGAILAGDAMLTLAQQVLLEAGPPVTPAAAMAATRLLADATQELIRGQVEDLAFERRSTVSVDECLRMAGGKTGALLGASAAIGAALADASAATVEALRWFGEEVGLAFQLVDDLLGIWGDPAATGKPVLSDLRSRKMTLPITYAVHAGGPAARELTERLSDPDTAAEEDLRRAADLVEAAGGRTWAMAEADRRLALGEKALADAAIPAEVRAELTALSRYVVEREN